MKTELPVLIDTCGWIEWLSQGKLSEKFEPYFNSMTNLIIPTLLQFELYKWIFREKDEILALEIIGLTEEGIVTPLDTNLALYAADLSKQHQLAMADAIIYATALKSNAMLITSDQHFQNLPQVLFFKKTSKT